MARVAGAHIFLRIDDLDRERVEPEYVQDIFDVLNFLELSWDEGPRDVESFEREWSQVHRMGLYHSALNTLRQEGHVFACNCSRAQVLRESVNGVYPGTCGDKGISLDAENVSWRLRTDNQEVGVRVLGGDVANIGRSGLGAAQGVKMGKDGGVSGAEGEVVASRMAMEVVKVKLPETMKDFVVRKRDGFPAYQLTSVMDDLYYNVDMVVRGEDLWASTVAQHFLAKRLGKGAAFGAISFYHHPLLMGEGGLKLSKSAGDTSIQFLRKQGFSAADIFGMIAKMGTS
jgi:glutamyl-tRNA synthetase